MKEIIQVRGEQAHAILGLLKQVATSDGAFALHEIHRETLHAMAEHLFQVTDFDPDAEHPPIKAAKEVAGTEELRQQVMNMAGILPFLEEEHLQERIDAVGRLGEAFGYDRKFTKRLHQLSHEAILGLAICLNRALSLEVGNHLWKGLYKLAESAVHLDGDKRMLERFTGYRDLDTSTFGRTLISYYDDNDFPLPGTPGAFFSNSLWTHDIHHVLSGYPTTPLGETCVLAFDGGMMDLDMGKALIAYTAQFQIGIQFDKGLRTWRNQFKPDVVMRAFERGGNCSVDYIQYDFDFGDRFTRSLAEVRAEFGIDPEGALVSAPGDKWCGDMGIVGMRDDDPDIIERKKSLLERMLAGKNTKQ